MGRKITGFTLIELVVVLVVVGIISVSALPRFFSKTGFEARGFADDVTSTLREAQKLAVAKRRNVCVSVSAGTLTLGLDTTPDHTPATCPGVAMTSPDGRSPYSTSPSSGISLVSTANFAFQPSGLPDAGADVVMTVSASGEPSRTVTIARQTGYVYTSY